MLTRNLRIILASASPRRKELLSYLGLPFDVVAPAFAKERDNAETIDQVRRVVIENARDKANSVMKEYDSLLISADTVVFCNNRLFGKPKDTSEAKEFLSILSHNPHWVVTGVYMHYKGNTIARVEETKVFMDPLNDEEIEEYLKREDVLDKAGAFAIQGYGASFINRIEGCFYNVMGFPLSLVRKMIIEIVKE